MATMKENRLKIYVFSVNKAHDAHNIGEYYSDIIIMTIKSTCIFYLHYLHKARKKDDHMVVLQETFEIRM